MEENSSQIIIFGMKIDNTVSSRAMCIENVFDSSYIMSAGRRMFSHSQYFHLTIILVHLGSF